MVHLSQAITTKVIPVQELSIQWLDLSKTAKYTQIKDISATPLGEVAQKVVDTYNSEKEKEKSETRYELQDTPAHDERDYQLKVYSYSDTRVTRLAQQVQTKPKQKSNSFYLLFFYKEKSTRRLIAITSSKAWPVVRNCISYEFPIRVAEKTVNAQKIVQIVRLCLFGANGKETLLNPGQYELYKTQTLYYLIEAFRAEIRHSSSLADLVGTCCLKITTGGLLRIEKKIPLEDYPPILDLFARYVEGEKTYNSEGCEESPDPLFEFLHFLQPAERFKAVLDQYLIRHIYRTHKKGQKQLVYVRHKLLEDFLFSTQFEIKVGKTFKPFGSRPPELEAIIEKLDASDEQDFVEKAKLCKLRFCDKDEHNQVGYLVDFFEGEVRLSSGDTYFKVRGMWYKLTADYLGLVHDDFKTVLKHSLIPEGGAGWLPRPWKGNAKGGKVTEDGVKAKLVSSTGIRKFMRDLKSLTVCYVEGTKVMQDKLVGEVLKNKAVAKHKDAIEKILKKGFSDQKIKDACGEEADEVIEALKMKRKVLQEATGKPTFVLNPFPYPMKSRAELKGKYEAFVSFLEELYAESESTEDEESYNRAYLLPPYGQANGYLVFDQICPDNIEPCDVLRYTDDTVYLYHVKEEFGQHTRDACSQIMNSAKMIRSALSTHQPQNYLQKLWEKATTLGKDPSDWLKSVKAQIDKLGEQPFLNIFRNRKVVFVYAYLPGANKSLADEAKVKSCLTPDDLKVRNPGKVFSMLIALGYLDSHGRLTGKFHSTKKDNFKLTGEFALISEAVFKQLDAFRSISKSTLAKIELLQLALNLRALNFEFRIAEIPRSNGNVVAPPSPPSGTQQVDDDIDDDFDLSLLATPPGSIGSMPVSTTVTKITNGPIGFERKGNTCYMIASLQLLFNIDPFRKLLTEKKALSNFTKALFSLLEEADPSKTEALLSNLRTRLFQIVPEGTLGKGAHRETAQHDAHEFLQFVLEGLKWPTFSTRTKFTTSRGTRQSNAEAHCILSLPLNGSTFQEIIDDYFALEECDDKKNPYEGEFGGKSYKFPKWQQQIEMTSFPSFLFVQLKRFDNSGGKDSSLVLFPLDGIVTIGVHQYEIVGFVNHHGQSTDSGHYTADIKNLRDPTQEQWVHCDDDALKETTPNDPPARSYLIALRKK